MPRVRRTRVIDASRDAVWEVVADPHHLPRWWPGVERVEEASRESWTEVLRTGKGKVVRADFTRVDEDSPGRLAWRQEIDESPFERFLAKSLTEVSLEPEGRGATRVGVRMTQRLRGLARLGSPMVRRATARQLDEALEGLDAITGRRDA